MALVATHGRRLWGLGALLSHVRHILRPKVKRRSPPQLCKYLHLTKQICVSYIHGAPVWVALHKGTICPRQAPIT